MNMFDVVIVGGGHAGIEAAWMAAQFDLKVAIVTIPNVPIASAPCNPSIGGVGKGQVVREIDALGGIMGRIADRCAIQCRILNESKGFAVQSTRVQIDKELYPRVAEEILSEMKNISIIREKVQTVTKEDFFKIKTTNSLIESKKVIVTTGTFLNGKLHVGSEQTAGGRHNTDPSNGLTDIFSNVQTLGLRFKTGTPPRLAKESINFDVLEEQNTDPRTQTFHFDHGVNERFLKQVPCYLTRTAEDTLKIVRDNKDKSPMYNGQINAVGARYCPSLEDKAYRYPDRNSHHVFVEPESLESNSYYPSGISSSLPRDVQEDFVHTIKGLEKAKILVHGYAVEYDVVDTAKLDETLQYIDIEGLYFAGQVNGTSGYEEAGGQGLIAGVNAALSFRDQKLVISRDDSYIGVMIEDLISNKRDEPYRLFTARSENRLYIREDNTVIRMSPYRKVLGLKQKIDSYQQNFQASFNMLIKLIENYTYKANIENQKRFFENDYGTLNTNITLKDLLRRPNLNPVEVLVKELEFHGMSFDKRVVQAVAITAKYDGYIKRAMSENARYKRMEKKKINWERIVNSPNIANECKQRIEEVRPTTFSQLQKINGIRPATLAFVAGDLI